MMLPQDHNNIYPLKPEGRVPHQQRFTTIDAQEAPGEHHAAVYGG